MKMEKMNLQDLKYPEWNPRKITDQEAKKIIKSKKTYNLKKEMAK